MVVKMKMGTITIREPIITQGDILIQAFLECIELLLSIK